MSDLDKLQRLYEKKRSKIDEFLKNCTILGQSDNAEELFSELCYNLLTPQVNADEARDTLRCLRKSSLLFSGDARMIEAAMRGLGYRLANKAEYLYKARARFFDEGCEIPVVVLVHGLSVTDPLEARDLLADPQRGSHISGMGMKVASHFLRNLGLSHNQLAILDRYILDWLLSFEVIDQIPKTLTRRRYLDIEKRMKEWSNTVAYIPMDALDLLLWWMGRGDI